MTKDSLLRIYSMTKPIVAVTAMSMWEEGKFKLDDPISEHLPEWKEMKVREGDKEVPAKGAEALYTKKIGKGRQGRRRQTSRRT